MLMLLFGVVCLQKEPHKRPSAVELLQHPFIAKAKTKKLIVDLIAKVSTLLAVLLLVFNALGDTHARGVTLIVFPFFFISAKFCR